LLKDIASLPRAFWLISVMAILENISSQAYRPLVPQLAVKQGMSGATIGTLFALAGIVPVLLALPIGASINRVGIKRTLAMGAVARGTASLVLVFAPSFGSMLLSLTISSGSLLLVEVGQQAFIASLGKGRDMERNFGWFTFVMGIGMVVGPLFSGIISDASGFRWAFLGAGLVSFLALVAISLLDEPSNGEAKRTSVLHDLTRACGPILAKAGVLSAILLVVFLYFSLGAWEIYLPALLAERQFTSTQIGFVVSSFTFATMVARPLLSAGTDLLGRQRLAAACLLLGAFSLAAVPAMRTVPVLVLAAVGCGIGRGILPLISLVTISDQTTREDRSIALSLRMMAIRLESMIHPVVFGAVAGLFGTGASFTLAGVLMMASAAWFYVSKTARTGLRRLEVADE
jgi:MFS family permease